MLLASVPQQIMVPFVPLVDTVAAHERLVVQVAHNVRPQQAARRVLLPAVRTCNLLQRLLLMLLLR